MLVLSRKPGEKVIIGDDIVLTVVSVIGNRVRLGITAPEDVCILRAELAEWRGSATENKEWSEDPELVPASSQTPVNRLRRYSESPEGNGATEMFRRRSR